MHYKRFLALLMSVCLVFAFTGCKKEQYHFTPANEDEEFVLEVYAPTELMGVMTDLVERYSSVAPRASVRVSFDDGVVQAAKIEAGYPCDVYISDEEMFMNWLDIECSEEDNPNRNDKIVSSTRHAFAEGPGNEDYMPEDQELAEGEVYNTTFSVAVCRATVLSYESEQFINFMMGDDVADVYETYGYSAIEE